jgi:hypothetical protein
LSREICTFYLLGQKPEPETYITFESVMLIPPCGRSIPAFFPALIELSNAGILLPQGGISMTGGGVLPYE